MEVCEGESMYKSHVQIVYDEDSCPLCKAYDDLRERDRAINEIVRTIENLKAERDNPETSHGA